MKQRWGSCRIDVYTESGNKRVVGSRYRVQHRSAELFWLFINLCGEVA